VIGATLVMKGELTLDEDLVINGTFIGPINNPARRLSVTSFGMVQGDVQGGSVDIAGTLEGTISGSALILRRTARLSGSLSAESVVVEQGTNLTKAVLAGRVTCT
jgi:cytoskeletal protein CcmA (bactofilin family)